MQVKISAITAATLGLLFLGACSSNQAPNSTRSPAASTGTETQPSAATPATSAAQPGSNNTDHGGQGGQVIESGAYHLELVTAKETEGTHIDFFLQKGDNHEPISNAKVTAQVQSPDGSQNSLEMKYDPGDKHYTAILPNAAAGEYKVAILSDIGGEKVNGRFSFTR